MIKFVIVLSCVVGAIHGLGYSGEFRWGMELAAATKECGPPNNYPAEDDLDLILDEGEPRTEEGKCFLACMFKRWKYIDETGNVNDASKIDMVASLKDLAIDLYEATFEIFEYCRKTVETGEECAMAVRLNRCMRRQAEEMGINGQLWLM